MALVLVVAAVTCWAVPKTRMADSTSITEHQSYMKPSLFHVLQHDASKDLSRGGIRMVSENPSIPVDFVITWYNSRDERARQQLAKRMNEIDKSTLPPESTAPKRYSDAGELRYNFRALEQYAGWVRKFHLVVADEMALPDWLNQNNPKLQIVRHSQIFSCSSCLPTFNSHAIESRLHMIPDLSEHFVYLNDDTFINRQVSTGTFFTSDSRPRVWPGWDIDWAIKSQVPHNIAVRNSMSMMRPTRWNSRYSVLHHAKALRKAAFAEIHHKYGAALHQTENSPFRSRSDVWPILMAAVECVEMQLCKADLHVPSTHFSVLGNDGSPAQVMQKIAQSRPTFFCLNDSDPAMAPLLEAALAAHFTTKSSFEI